MRTSVLFLVTALASAMALRAQAGPLGGLGGSLGGGLGGSLGGLSGGLNGSLNGRVDPNLDAEQQAAAAARAKARQARIDASRTASSATAVVALPAVGDVTRTVTAQTSMVTSAVASVAPSAVVVAPVVGLPSVQTQVIRGRQTTALADGGVVVVSEPQSYLYMDRQADDLRRDLRGTGIQVRRDGRAIVLEMPSDVTFAFDKSDIRPRFYEALDAVARTLNQYPATYVDVIGHTDAIGSAGYNQALSERRAAAVAGFIEHREEIPARFYVAGRGKFEPVASNATTQGRAANRRVEILLHPYTGG